MGKQQQDELVKSLHKSVEHIISTYRLIRAPPPSLTATSLLDYAKLIENLLEQLYAAIPRLCVPLALYKKAQRESIQCGEILQRYVNEHAKVLGQMQVLQHRLKEVEGRQKYMKESYEQMLKNNHYYKKKAQSLKKSGEQSIKNMLEVVSSKQDTATARHSLPRLDKKEKLSLLWLIGPNSNNQKLVNHLISKG